MAHWHMGVLEHYPGMLRQKFYAAMLATDLFSILPGVYKKSKILLAASDLGDDVPIFLHKGSYQVHTRFTLLQSSSDIAHDLLHSNLSAENESITFTISYVLVMALATAL